MKAATEADILEAIRAALAPLKPGDSGLSVVEICQAKGWGKDRVRGTLRKLMKEGKATVSLISRLNMIGRLCVVPVYRLTGKKK